MRRSCTSTLSSDTALYGFVSLARSAAYGRGESGAGASCVRSSAKQCVLDVILASPSPLGCIFPPNRRLHWPSTTPRSAERCVCSPSVSCSPCWPRWERSCTSRPLAPKTGPLSFFSSPASRLSSSRCVGTHTRTHTACSVRQCHVGVFTCLRPGGFYLTSSWLPLHTTHQTLVYTCLQHQESQEAARAAERIARYREAAQRGVLYTTPQAPAPPTLYDASTHTARGVPVHGTSGYVPGTVYTATVCPHAFQVRAGSSKQGGGGGVERDKQRRGMEQAPRGSGARHDDASLPPVRTDVTLPKLVLTVDKRGRGTGVPAYGHLDASSLTPSLTATHATPVAAAAPSSPALQRGDVVVEVRAPPKFRWAPPQALPVGAPWVPGPEDGVRLAPSGAAAVAASTARREHVCDEGSSTRVDGGGGRATTASAVQRPAAAATSAPPAQSQQPRRRDGVEGKQVAGQKAPPRSSSSSSSQTAAQGHGQRKDARVWRGGDPATGDKVNRL